jgi:hypothetical protein
VPLNDGRLLGSCRDVAACEDGESICVNTGTFGLTPTPYFRTCEGGEFGSELQRCDNDETCFASTTIDGLRIHSCGGECGTGWTRCGPDGVETCGSDGSWGDGVACTAGHCENVGSNQAKCVLDCIPGSLGCDGSYVTTSDGMHQGQTQAVTCKPDGTWPSLFDPADAAYINDCDVPGGETCRISSRGEGLGCVECIGPNVLGGNDQGVSETRCDPAALAKLQLCGADNTWAPSTDCGAGTTCTGPVQDCGYCTSELGSYLPCTDTNLNNSAETCGTTYSCYDSVTATYIYPCTESNIPALPPVVDGGSPVQRTCADIGQGSPVNWAGFTDCCSSQQVGVINSCQTNGYGPASAWGGQPDCCRDYQNFLGSGLSYCAP